MISKKRIMIVENEGISAMSIQATLQMWGHTVTSIEVTAENAIEMAEADRPDLVLMDISLSGTMDGIDAAGKIYSKFNIPVIYITAHSDEKMVERIKSTQPFGYIIKPFDERELIISVEIALYKHEIEQQLKKKNKLLDNIIESLTHPFYVINVEDYTIVLANTAARECGQAGAATCYELTHRRSQPCDSTDHPCIIKKVTEERKAVTVEHIHYDQNGNPVTIEVYGYPIFNRDGEITQVIEYNLDITNRREMEERLEASAITDDLTGLFNRRGFFTLAKQQCKLAERSKRGLALLYLDLDGMKDINDELGHAEGDRALMDTANILRRSLRESDIIARIGGDEFAVLLTDTSDPEIDRTIITHIKKNIKLHNEKESRRYRVMLSIGMSAFDPERPCSIDDLLMRADRLMYEDKRIHKLEQEVKPLLKESKFERRIYKRFKTIDDCWAELDISGKVRICDISLGGVRLRTSEPLATDIIYNIKISPDVNEEITLTGIVLWSTISVSESESHDILPYEAGLKFIEVSDSIKSSLEKFTENMS